MTRRMTRSDMLAFLLALGALAAPGGGGAQAAPGRAPACAGPPPCTHGCVLDPRLARCRPPGKNGAEDGSRGVINDAVSFCDVTPPCPEGCKPSVTNRSCVSAK